MLKFLTINKMHRLLYVYNGVAIFILMAFMCLTQERRRSSAIVNSNFLHDDGGISDFRFNRASLPRK